MHVYIFWRADSVPFLKRNISRKFLIVAGIVLWSVLKAFENGVIPKNTSKRLKNELEKEIAPLKVLAILKKNLPPTILSVSPTTQQIRHDRREVILSEYLLRAG